MVDGTYGQYAVGFKGSYLFHSVCYADDSHDAMIREAYNNLGSAASMGCVRLEAVNAKWIFDNCPAGTPVTVYSDPDDPGPLGKPERTVDVITEEMYNGWDPTDPAEGNPWRTQAVSAIEMLQESAALTAGESAKLTISVEPENAVVFWSSSDETVATVDKNGTVTALAAGTAYITAQGLTGIHASCPVTVEGDLLPFDDLLPGAWYYPEIRKAVESGLFSGVGDNRFAPDETMTRAMAVQVLYNASGRPTSYGQMPYTDVAEDAWYRDAIAWAAARGLLTDIADPAAGVFAPEEAITRQELAAVLWRFAGCPYTFADLTAYSDADQIAPFAATAMGWMVDKGLLQGSYSQLQPDNTATRAQTAAILQRTREAGLLPR